MRWKILKITQLGSLCETLSSVANADIQLRVSSSQRHDPIYQMPMKAITDNRSGQATFGAAQKECGRCGIAMKEDQFCAACRKFFRALNGRRATFIPVDATERNGLVINGK